jgi:dolichol-phosphate mannosyltransferase
MAERPRVSVVIPAYNEAPCLCRLYDALKAVCDALPYAFEFLFVDDGSTDGTEEVLARLRREDERVRYLVMSRNFGHQGALSAGLAHACGDAVIMMDGDLQHPPALIPRLLECWQSGHDVVNTVRLDTQGSSRSKKVCSRLFYAAFRALTGSPLAPGSADFRLMARRPVDALNALPERHRFVRGLVPWLGFRQTSVEFQAPARFAGQPKYTFARSLRLALEGITSFNLYPLRLVTILGFVVMAGSLAYGASAWWCQTMGWWSVPGWVWIAFGLSLSGGCQLAALGIISEYVGRTLDQVKGRPLYIVRTACGVSTRDETGHGSEHRQGQPGHGAIPPHHLPASSIRQPAAATPSPKRPNPSAGA